MCSGAIIPLKLILPLYIFILPFWIAPYGACLACSFTSAENVFIGLSDSLYMCMCVCVWLWQVPAWQQALVRAEAEHAVCQTVALS